MGTSGEDSRLSLPQAQVRCLVEQLGFCNQRGEAKKKKKNSRFSKYSLPTRPQTFLKTKQIIYSCKRVSAQVSRYELLSAQITAPALHSSVPGSVGPH